MRYRLGKLLELLLLLGLAAVVAVFAVRSWRNMHSGTEEDSADTAAVQTKAVTALTYSNASATLSFALNDEKQWFWTEYPDYPLDTAHVEALAELLSSFAPALYQADADEDTLDNAGLITPEYSLSVTYSDSETLSVQFGGATDDGSRYMHYTDEERSGDIYLADAALVEALDKSIYDMYRLESLPQLTERLIDYVTVTCTVTTGEGDAAVTEEESRTYTMKEKDGSYFWYCGVRKAENDAGVGLLTDALVKLKLNRCLVWQPIGESLQLCGLRPSLATVEIGYFGDRDKSYSFTLSVGALCGESERYVRLNGSGPIYCMDAELLTPFLTIAGVTDTEE